MKKVRNVFVIGVVLAGLAAAGIGPATAQSSNEKPKATEVGVTATEIHIGVVADVDNPFAPGLFQGAVDGVKAGAAYLNSKAGGGGLAGRKVVVDFYDSKLNGNESRNATIQGCQNDYALVGHLGAVPDPGRRHRRLQGPGRRGDGDPRPVRGHDRRARVLLADVVPGVRHRPRLPDRQPEPADVLRQPGSGEVGALPEQGRPPRRRPSWATTPRTPPAAARSSAWPRSRPASRRIRATPWSPCRDVTRRACSRRSWQKMKTDSSNWSLIVACGQQALLTPQRGRDPGPRHSKILWECVSCYGNDAHHRQRQRPSRASTVPRVPALRGEVSQQDGEQLRQVHEKVGGTPTSSPRTVAATLAFADAVNATVKSDGVNGLTRRTSSPRSRASPTSTPAACSASGRSRTARPRPAS